MMMTKSSQSSVLVCRGNTFYCLKDELLQMPWTRPASVPVGQVWNRFKGREMDGKPAKMYQIRDMEEKWHKRCLDMMQETFLRDEPLCEVLGIPQDPVSVQSIRANWEHYVSLNMSVACFTEVDGEPDELVGFNILVVNCKDDPEDPLDKLKGEPCRQLFRTLMAAEQMVDIYAHYGVDKYLTSSGLTVLPGHRGQNIAKYIFAAREPICKAMGIKATATVFTATASQVLAAKAGYEVLAVLDYADMKARRVDLTGCQTELAKLMGTKFT